MKKNFAVNIGYRIFNIDEDAYEKLNHYLDELRQSLVGESSVEEIIADIEGRIAELLEERLAGRTIVNIDDVQFVIDEMGAPEEFGGQDQTTEKEKSKSEGPRRLYRDPENRLLGGVCSGLGAFFSVDPLWIRLGFVILVLLMGSGILVYLALWLLVPLADSAAERLQMRGRKVNASNIADNIRAEFEEVKSQFKNKGKGFSNEFSKPNVRHGISEAGWVIIQIIRIVAGLFFVVFSLSIIISLLFAVFFKGLFSWHHAFNLFDFLTAWTQSPLVAVLLIVIGLLIILLPLFGLLFGGIRMILNLRTPGRVFRVVMLSIWSFAIAMGIVLAIYLALTIEKPRKTVETTEFISARQTIILDAYNTEYIDWEDYGRDDLKWEKGNQPYLYLHPEYKFVKSGSTNISIRSESMEFRLNSQNPLFSLKSLIRFSGDSAILLPAVIPVSMEGKNNIPSNIKFTVFIPESKLVKFTASMANVLYLSDDEALPRQTEGSFRLSPDGHWISEAEVKNIPLPIDSSKMNQKGK